MSDMLLAVDRLRDALSAGNVQSLPLEKALPCIYPVSCVSLPNLTVAGIRAYLERYAIALPTGLVTCRDRRLSGGIVAQYGHGLLFADGQDSDAEIRFTIAHEAKHFLVDHYYPRIDLLERFGDSIRPVLDGHRPPTRAERIDALLARTELAQHTHLLDREPVSQDRNDLGKNDMGRNELINQIEANADAFACELLAPAEELAIRWPNLLADGAGVESVRRVLIEEFGLPPAPASQYARIWLASYGKPVTLLHHLRLL